MTHSEKRSSPLREMQLAMFSGAIYGGVHTFTGHPFDTVSKKMLIQDNMSKGNVFQIVIRIYTTEGWRGFMKGVFPPLWGSVVYRSVMLGSYEYAYTYFDQKENSILKEEKFGGLRPMVPISTLFCALCRSTVEQPIEYAKVMGQTNKTWMLRDIYRGFGWQSLRTSLLLLPIFAVMDVVRRKSERGNGILDVTWGNFLVCGSASGASYLIFWPLETLKNLAQTSTGGSTLRERLKYVGGFRGLYRGVGPGVFSGFIRNGFAQAAMFNTQVLATFFSLRD